MPVICKICDTFFSTQGNLNKHCRIKHNIKKQYSSYADNVFNFKCLDCLCSFPRTLDLIEHLQTEHGQEISKEVVEFQSFEEFQSWKYDIERKELCNYVVLSKKKFLSSDEEVQYLFCNRSGNRKKQTNDTKDIINRKRNTKKQGSAKLNFNCISKIALRKKGAQFVATRIKNHYGHTTEIRHLRINPLDKQELASKLVHGISKNRILEDTRSKIIGSDLKRIDLLTRQDLDNIKKSYNIQLNDGVRHKNDAVEECKSLEKNPVLFYKPQGQPSKNLENDFNMTNNIIGTCDRKEKILKELSDLQMLVHNQNFDELNETIFNQILANLHSAKNLLQLPSNSKISTVQHFGDKAEVPVSKKIIPQNRIFSNKKNEKTEKIKKS